MFDIDVHGINNASIKEREKFTESINLLETELRSGDFWLNVMEEYDSWLYNNDMTFKQFKRMFLSGVDNFNTEVDNDLDIYISFYYSFRSVIGYTKPSTYFTWINRKFFKRFDLADIAGNVAHEYLHNLGFGHPNTNKQSLTYQFGYLIRDRIKSKIKFNQNQKITIWSMIKDFFTSLF